MTADRPWHVEWESTARRWLRKADPQTARKIGDALSAVAASGIPGSKGKALSGNLAGLWRYRVGDYRVICDLIDHRLVVLVIEIGHRSDVYD